METDIISKLPNCLLAQILAYLPTKDSVRTSVLSTRWRGMWLSVADLDLDSDYFYHCEEHDAFSKFVDRFLEIDRERRLQKLRIISNDPHLYLEEQIVAAVERGIQHLEFQGFAAGDGPFDLYNGVPPNTFTCETLVSLKLDFAALEIPGLVSLPRLKFLHLERVEYRDPLDLETIISGCPVLEHLTLVREIFDIDGIEDVRVRSQTLKSFSYSLVFAIKWRDFDTGVVIDAPRLEYMSLRDRISESCVIQSLGPSCKIDVDVNFNLKFGALDPEYPWKINIIRKFLSGVSGVRHMIVSRDTMEIIRSYWKLGPLPRFCNLSHLHATFSNTSLEMLPALLGTCPNLRSFALEFAFFPKLREINDSYVPRCFQSTLELVEIKGKIKLDAMVMKIVRYFVQNSSVLKKLVLRLGDSVRTNEEPGILKELRAFARQSLPCRIVLV